MCVGGGVLKSLILQTSLLVHADADLVFSAHLLTCVDKGRLRCTHISWAVTACLALEQARDPLPPSDLVLYSIDIGQLSESVLI